MEINLDLEVPFDGKYAVIPGLFFFVTERKKTKFDDMTLEELKTYFLEDIKKNYETMNGYEPMMYPKRDESEYPAMAEFTAEAEYRKRHLKYSIVKCTICKYEDFEKMEKTEGFISWFPKNAKEWFPKKAL